MARIHHFALRPRMARAVTLAAAALLGGVAAAPAAPAAAASAAAAASSVQLNARHARSTTPIHPRHAGRWIIDRGGRVVVLHGLNMVYKRAPYDPAAVGFGADDAAYLKRLGFNVVRVGVIWKAVEPNPGVYDDHYLGQIAATVRTLRRHGIFSLLDFHQDMYNELFQGEGAPDWAVQTDGLPNLHSGFPGNYLTDPALQRAEDHFWSNSPGPGGLGLEDRYAAVWSHVARRFRDVRGVLGYELLNEPSPGTEFAACLAGCPGFDTELTAFNRRVAKAIRSVDRHTLIFYEPEVGFDFGTPTTVGALRDGPAGFAFHDYCLTASANGCPGEPRGFTNAVSHVASTHEALILTEFGSTPNAGDLTGMVSMADRYMVPWIEWSYCPCDDPTGATPDPLVIDPRQPPTGSNVGQLALETLVEPYPHLIAGTPQAWSYNRQTGTFALRYSTAKARGHGRFAKGAITEVATPGVIYGRRYAVHVRGGAIASRRGARVLKVAACRGARRISITILRHGRNRETCRPARKSK